jgi:hypothetical protein
MSSPRSFDLAAYLSEKFPSLTLGGGLFYRWPVGIRFELGPDAYRERAPKLYEVVFAPEDSCVIVSQDWPEHTALHQRYFRVFSLPGAFDSRYPLGLQSLQMTAEEHGEQETFSLQWAQVPARSFQYGAVLEGIANADHAQTPSVSGRIYFLNPMLERKHSSVHALYPKLVVDLSSHDGGLRLAPPQLSPRRFSGKRGRFRPGVPQTTSSTSQNSLRIACGRRCHHSVHFVIQNVAALLSLGIIVSSLQRQ